MNKPSPKSPEDCVADRLRLVAVSSANDIFELARGTGSDGAFADEASTAHQLAPLKSLCEQLHRLGCKSVVLQHPVVDKDYQAEFQAFYSTTFSNYSRYSTRLHFFTCAPAASEPALDFVDRVYSSAPEIEGYRQTPGYLGYTNVRPITSCPIGRTVISQPAACSFLTVRDSFRSTLAGRDFWVVGAPFMQQDSAVAACAQVAIWMALRVNRKKDGKEDKTVADISDAATRELVFGRVLPSAGLGIQNMLAALEKFGYHGELLNFRKIEGPENEQLDQIKERLYPYLESGIPIIGLCDGTASDFSHAVVIVGHGWDATGETHQHKSRCIKLESGKEIVVHSPTVWIDDLYVNNDSHGPYQACGKRTGGPYALASLKAALPLLPKDVYMSAEQAFAAAERTLGSAFTAILGVERFKLSAHDLDHKFVLRHYLTSRHEFRKWADAHQSPSMVRYYRQKHLPEKLWIFELNLLGEYYKAGSADGARLNHRIGELLIDPTGDPHDFPVLSLHLNLQPLTGEATGLLMNVDFQPFKIDMLYLEETVNGYPLHIPHAR